MRAGMLAFAGCVIILYLFGTLPPLSWLAASAVLLSGLAVLPWRNRLPIPVAVLVLVSFYVVVEQMDRTRNAMDRWPGDSSSISVRGYPCSMPESMPAGGVRVIFCITDGAGHGLSRTRLRFPEADNRSELQGPMTLTLQADRGTRASYGGGFDPQRYRFRHRLAGEGRVIDWSRHQGVCRLVCRYHQARSALILRLEHHAGHAPHYPLIESLAFGSRGLLSDHHWDVLRATGTNHLMAISGLHIGLVAGLGGLISRRALRGRTHEPKISYLMMLLAGTLYALAAGLTIPTRRALIMVAVAGWVWLSGRRVGAWDAWLVALSLVLLADPMALLDMGFWLSFGAVACLILAFAGRLQSPRTVSALMLAQLAVVSGLWPVLTALDQPASALSFPVNLAAIPLMSLVVMPLLFMTLIPMLAHPWSAQVLLPGVELLFNLAWTGLESVSQIALWLPDWPWLRTLLVALVLMLMLFPVGVWFRVLGAALLLALLLIPGAPEQEALLPTEVRFLSVGHGQAVLVRDGDWVVLYDLGQRGWGRYRRFDDRVPVMLEERGIDAIDELVVSDGPSDSAVAFLERAGITVTNARDGLRSQGCEGELEGPSGSFSVQLWQWSGESHQRPSSHCVLLIESDQGAVLLPGGVDRAIERRILKWLGDEPDIRGLLLPGRGAPDSSQLSWVEWLSPEWGFPPAHIDVDQQPVKRRYQKVGTEVVGTDCPGDVVWSPESGKLDSCRNERRLWR